MYLYENLDREFWILVDNKHIYFLKDDKQGRLEYINSENYKKMPIKVIVNNDDYMDYHLELLNGDLVAKTFITKTDEQTSKLILNPNISVKTLRRTGPRYLKLVIKNDIPLEYSVCIDNYIGLCNGVFWDMPYTAYRSYDGFPYCNDKLGEVITTKEALEYAQNHIDEIKNFWANVDLANQTLQIYNDTYGQDKHANLELSHKQKIMIKK